MIDLQDRPCEWCGSPMSLHDYQEMARHCYPIQIKAKDAEIERLRDARDTDIKRAYEDGRSYGEAITRAEIERLRAERDKYRATLQLIVQRLQLIVQRLGK